MERKNHHVVEMGVTLLGHSHFPLSFWSYAFQTSTYIINKLPTSILSLKSAYEILYHELPDYAHVKTFGWACYPYLYPYNSHKLHFCSKEYIF